MKRSVGRSGRGASGDVGIAISSITPVAVAGNRRYRVGEDQFDQGEVGKSSDGIRPNTKKMDYDYLGQVVVLFVFGYTTYLLL